MAFGEVIHYVPHSNAWPEPVRGIASLLLPLHSTDRPGFQESPASNPTESPGTPAAPAPATGSYTAIDFQHLIHSTAADLKSLAKLPHYGGARSTVPLWSQLLHAVADNLSPEVLILEDTPFIMPQAQEVESQPPDLIDGHAILIAAHFICSTPRNQSDKYSTSPGSEKKEDQLVYSANSSPRVHSDGSRNISGYWEGEDVLMYSSNSGSVGLLDGLDGLDLPLQAHMLPGRGKWQYAVLPVLLVADAHNIVPLICSTLYQRRVWGIREPVVGLCCSKTGTIATAIFGWLDFDQSEEGCMPVVHLAVAAGDHLDPSMGVFDFTDSFSAISLAQFVLRLRSHFQDIKGIASIEAVNSLTPFHWRSDLPAFETQMGGHLTDRVASWTHQVSSETSSSSGPRTPSPLSDPLIFLSSKMSPRDLDTVHEEDASDAKTSAQSTRAMGITRPGNVLRPRSSKDAPGSQKSSGQSYQPVPGEKEKSVSRLSNSSFAAISDAGLVEGANISNWLLERNAFTVGHIAIPSHDSLAEDSGINVIIEMYDQITAFTWSDAVQPILSASTIDSSVFGVRDQLFERYASGNHPSAIEMPKEDAEFISARLSALLHAVKGACSCQGIANLHGANEAERRHEWDALLLKFFQPVASQRDVLLERTLNSARNLAVHDASFAKRARFLTRYYERFCFAQRYSLPSDDDADLSHLAMQAFAAQERASRFTLDIVCRVRDGKFLKEIIDHSHREPAKGISDAALVISCSGVATAMLQCIHEGKAAQDQFLKSFILVHGKPDKQDVTPPIKNHYPHSPRHDPASQLWPPTPSHGSERQQKRQQNAMLQNVYLVHPDHTEAVSGPSEESTLPEASGQDLLLPVLLSEYKKKNDSTITQAMNQTRTHLVSALRFLDALGITDQPVFGLVVNGCLGAVTMAWQKDEKIYIMERNVRHYDITDPLDAFQFVSVLLQLARYGLELRARFEEKKDAFYESLRKSTYTRWSKWAQIQGEDSQGCGPEAQAFKFTQ